MRYKTGPVPVPLTLPSGQTPPARAVVVVAEEAVAPVMVEQILDPVGRAVTVDERVLSERLMFSFGYGGLTVAEMAEEMAASVLWLTVVMREHTWLRDALEAGVSAADEDRVRRSVRSLDKLVDGHKLDQEKVLRDGTVVPFVETVGPSTPAVVKVLESRDPQRYGKAATVVQVQISSEVMEATRRRIQGQVAEAASEQASDAEFKEADGGR